MNQSEHLSIYLLKSGSMTSGKQIQNEILRNTVAEMLRQKWTNWGRKSGQTGGAARLALASIWNYLPKFWQCPGLLHMLQNPNMTQCQDEFRNLSGCVTEILTASRINIFFFENTMRKLRSIAFQPCISWGGQYFWNGSNKWFRPNFRPENTNLSGHFSWSPDFEQP